MARLQYLLWVGELQTPSPIDGVENAMMIDRKLASRE